MAAYPCCSAQADGAVLLRLYVQPRASKNEFAGLHNQALKLRLTSPPVDGKANKAVLAFLAKVLGVSKSSLVIKSGQQSRTKTVLIEGRSLEQVEAALAALPGRH
ncbi:DUF167 domain-containing protein [Desulfogranum mediterraneum]|uniref:DUF167 domain-containing protein n=1 Tax=Desulfogranum mediterraneum TaxID=160661 RepID=UPI00054E91B7|nr:DUF167 domain-containing protein [Desulfogranum mediterraneum]